MIHYCSKTIARFVRILQVQTHRVSATISKEGEKLENYTKYQLKAADELTALLSGKDKTRMERRTS